MNRPIALMCYICGREFGTKSLAIHIKTCQKKWQTQESMKPPKQRRPCPRPPPGMEQLLAKDNITKKDIGDFNNGSYNTFVDQALVQCEFCGRKFNPKSLVAHQKACSKTSPMTKKHYVSNEEKKKIKEEEEDYSPTIKVASKGYNIPEQSENQNVANMNLIGCCKCGRKFAAERVAKHEKICKGPQIKHKGISEKYDPMEAKQHKPQKLNSGKQAKWKNQHNELMNAMKAMRQMKAHQAKGGKLSDLPPPPRSNYDHYVACKYCGRNFAPDVAERHIPRCASIINKPGGIKPSKIQEKYIGGTGAKKPTIQAPVKPKMGKR